MNCKGKQIALLIVAASFLIGPLAMADAVTDWNTKAGEIVSDAKLGPQPASRVLAIVHTAMYEAANAITKRYPASERKLQAAPGASVDAAIAAAARTTLVTLLPSQSAAIDSAYEAAIGKAADAARTRAGTALGEQAAAAVLSLRADDGAAARETYRPYTAPGVYVPTVIPAVPQWSQRKPWLMTSAAQFRPGPPPKLSSDVWARDYNEIKALGSRNSTQRSAAQTDIARFWEAAVPSIYYGPVHSVANVAGREVTQNARLFAAVAQAMDDALIALFDAKYYYNFWRPVTAIRNGDLDGNDATERDPSWTSFIDAPMHPEYPCAHCILVGAVCTVLQAEIGSGPVPTLTTTSPTAKGAARSWKTTEDLMQEVANARIYQGVHYRNSTEVGLSMARQVGALAVAKFPRRAD